MNDPRRPRAARRSERPTPVRQGAPPAAQPEDPPTPQRTFETTEGDRWTVEVAGRSRAGHRGGSQADMMLLVFRAVDGGGGGADGAREAMAVGSELDDLPEGRLAELLGRAGPFRPTPDGNRTFFSDTRRPGGS